MSENELMESIDQIDAVGGRLAAEFEMAQRQGRMPTMAQARQLDGLSKALLQEIKNLPQNACRTLVAPALRQRAERVLAAVRATLEQVLLPDPAGRDAAGSAPRGAPGWMKAYSSF